ncbi:MAG: hypothetical protein N2260_07790 [Syntrophobacterales bacterium]|nr:hypothetical protein [Syntrophobacterales bacterium]
MKAVSSRAFTLAETVVILLIVSFAISLVIPKVIVGSRQMKERGFVVTVQSLMERARTRAMVSGQPAVVWIDGERRQIAFGSSKVDIPKNVDIYGQELTESEGRYFLKFFPDGSSSSKRLEIVFDGTRRIFFTFNPVTGSIHWYEEISS